MFIIYPEVDKKFNPVFQEIMFLGDPLQWVDKIRSFRENNPSLTRIEAIRQVTKDFSWKWFGENKQEPTPDIANTNYGSFAFSVRAMECLDSLVQKKDFIDIQGGYFFFVYDKNLQTAENGSIFPMGFGEIGVRDVFRDRYIRCGLRGIKFTDPSLPFWKR